MLAKFVSLNNMVDSPKTVEEENEKNEVETEGGADGQSQSEAAPEKRAGSKQSHRTREPSLSGKSPKRKIVEELEEQPRFKQEHQRQHKHKTQQREEDLRQMRERLNREQMNREEKFEDMIDDIQVQNSQNVQAGILLMDQQQAAHKKKAATFSEWDSQVYNRITFRLNKCLNPNDDGKGSLDDMELRAGFDPLKRQMHEQNKEDTFRRESNSLLFSIAQRPSDSSSLSAGPQKSSGKGELTIKELEQIWTERSTTRPVLDTELWSQERFPTTVDGLSANTGRREDGKFHTQKRRGEGRHLPDKKENHVAGFEQSSAGKVRTRLEGHNYCGVLEGNWAKRGSAYKFKFAYGASHAVPCGDHYRYETGVTVTDREFPLGKKVFKNMH